MFDPMIKYLNSNGYRIISKSIGHQRGPDIIAERNGIQLIIEMKGDTKALSVDLGTAIFQLMRTMDGSDNKKYALAVTKSYERYVEQITFPLEKMDVSIFIVNNEVKLI